MSKFISLIMVLLGGISLPASAATFEVGVENIDYLPFSTIANTQYHGFYRDIFDKFSADSGHTFVYRPLPIKRLTDDFVNGKLDFKIPDNEVWAQAMKVGKNVSYSLPLVTYTDGIMVKPADKSKPYGELDTIVTVRGFTPFPFLDDIASGKLKLKEANSLESVIKMVEAGRVKGAFVNVSVAQYYLDTVMGKKGLLAYDAELPKGISEISLSTIKHPEVIAAFNQWIKDHNEWLMQLKKQYHID